MKTSAAPQSDTPSSPNWHAHLQLAFTAQAKTALPKAEARPRTVLSHRSHHGPLRVQRPFYPEDGACHVYVVHPPGGIVGGDQLSIQLTAQDGARALVTTPAAGKFYRSQGLEAVQRVRIAVENASLEWLPQETIFYPDARARVQTRVELGANAGFIGWEIACLGFPARGLPLGAGHVQQAFELWKDGQPLLLDRLRLNGTGAALNARWGLGGAPVLGTLVAWLGERQDGLRGPAKLDEATLTMLRETAHAALERRTLANQDTHVQLSLSQVDGVLMARTLAGHADSVRAAFWALWQALRPRLIGCAATAPRIWST